MQNRELILNIQFLVYHSRGRPVTVREGDRPPIPTQS